MPYDVKKTGKDEYTVKKGGKTVGHTDKRNLRAYMGHLHSGDKPKKMKKEGIHDHPSMGRTTDAPHTNVKDGLRDYDPKKRAANLKNLADFGPKPKEQPKDKKTKKESIEGALDTVYAVQKPYSGCQLTSLVQPIDPLVGLGGSEVMPDNIHAVYPDQEMAQSAAETLYNEHVIQEKALEEKKMHVIKKIKGAIDTLEKQRKESVNMIKENPKDANTHKEKVAHIATQMEDLVNNLQRIEMSKKDLEKKEEKKDKKEKKEDIKEALKKALR